MKLIVQKGRTSLLVKLLIQDTTKSDGSGLTGLVFNSAGLVCYRARDDDGNAGGTAITLATATRGTWASGGFVEKDAANMPGVYEFGVPNAAIATGSETSVIMLKGATNMAPVALELQLVAFDPQNASTLGLTSLPVRLVKNTAYNNFVFLMIDSTDHVTPKTGLTVTGQVSKDGAAFGALTNAVTEIANGFYKVNLAAGDVNADSVALKFTATGADQTSMALATQTS
jgi:hypothetical protein